MLNAKEKAALREEVYGGVEGAELATGFEFAGRTKEGIAFSDGEDTFVVKVVVKNEGFDLEGALAEFAEAEAARIARAAKTKEKAE